VIPGTQRGAIAPLLALALGLGLVTAAGAVGFVREGVEYYRLAPRERLLHPRHDLLRSSGRLGLLCGVGGTALFAVNLTYLLRKRLAFLSFLGTLRGWMRLHVASGLLGAALILFHTSFLARSALGILAIAGLTIVVATGVLGRYLYAFVPRATDGHELDAQELRARVVRLRQELAAAGIAAPLLDEGTPLLAHAETGFFGRLFGVVAGSRAARRDYRRLRASVRTHERLRADARHLLPLARAFYRDRQRLARLSELRGLLGSWRFFHRWLAIVMIVLAAFHIAVAVRFGELWLLGGRA
jgi:hypothetical protein